VAVRGGAETEAVFLVVDDRVNGFLHLVEERGLLAREAREAGVDGGIGLGDVDRDAEAVVDGVTYRIAELVLTVGVAAPIALSTASASFSAEAGAVSVTVTTTGAWSATARVSWITLTTGASGNGSGTISDAVAAKAAAAARSGTITVGDKTHTINQAAPVVVATGSRLINLSTRGFVRVAKRSRRAS
jgi:hypothetical protein